MKKQLLFRFFTFVLLFMMSFNMLIAREEPKEYIKKTIEIFKERGGKSIVEIGSMVQPMTHPIDDGHCNHCLCGHSTLFWASTQAEVYTVDVDANRTQITRDACKDYPKVTALTQDGIEFLKNFDKPIDLLFLDAWDVSTPYYAERHLDAYTAAKHILHENSLILIDDTDIADKGKGRLVIPEALKDGYKIVFEGRQTLLAKKYNFASCAITTRHESGLENYIRLYSIGKWLSYAYKLPFYVTTENSNSFFIGPVDQVLTKEMRDSFGLIIVINSEEELTRYLLENDRRATLFIVNFTKELPNYLLMQPIPST